MNKTKIGDSKPILHPIFCELCGSKLNKKRGYGFKVSSCVLDNKINLKYDFECEDKKCKWNLTIHEHEMEYDGVNEMRYYTFRSSTFIPEEHRGKKYFDSQTGVKIQEK